MTIDYIMISFVCASVSDVCGYLFAHLIDDYDIQQNEFPVAPLALFPCFRNE
jgi:hypothetical protein